MEHLKTIWTLALLPIISFSLAQEPSIEDSIAQGKSEFYKRIENQIQFENVNRIAYYSDRKRLLQIRNLEKNQKWRELYPILREYTLKFGIENFYRDTDLLWRMARLTELYGDKNEAVQWYKLALKHRRQEMDARKAQEIQDSLAANENQYAPIDYYYELVDYRKEVDTLRPPRGKRLNMGALVNSTAEDYGPALAQNDKILIFTSKRNSKIKRGFDQVANEDLFISRKWGDFWSAAEPMEGINTQLNEGSACVSADGRMLIFSRCFSPDGVGDCDLYMATLTEDSVWGDIRNLGPQVNSISWDSHPSLSHSGDTLFFASDRIGGFGLSDIYFSCRQPNGEWGPAQNVGPVINTRNSEVSPFYHPAFDVLYFSSNGQLLNFGEFDIYKTYKTPRGWSDPLNIGPLVNGPGSEFYFTIDSQSAFLFYARSEETNMVNLDLFSFPLPMEARPDADTRLSGTVYDSISGDIFKKGIVSIIDLENGIEVSPKFLKEDGTFEFYLINNKNYLLIIQGDEFFRIEELFRLEGDMELNAYTQSISSKIKFQSIEFDNGKSDLKPEMFADLYKVADFLIDNPDFKLIISGHTDSDGSAEFNLKLSQDRANSIRDFITHFGKIPSSRVTAVGFGSTKPIVEEKTEEDKRLNRRVEFEIYRPSKEELEKMRRDIIEESEGDWPAKEP